MSLTIKHPTPDFTGSHSGLAFENGTAEIPALETEAREPLLAHGFTIEGEDDVPESPEEEAARLALEAAAAQAAADEAAKKAAEEQRIAEAKAAAEAEKKAAAKK